MGSERGRAELTVHTAKVAEAIGARRLGAWEETRDRLLPRLVLRSRAGPLAVPVPGVLGNENRARLVVDIAVDVPGGLVVVDRSLVEAWSVPIGRIRGQARDNLARRPDPLVATAGRHPARPSLLVDGSWTGGWLVAPERLMALAGLDGHPGGAVAAGFGPTGPEVLVVVPGEPATGERSGPGGHPVDTAARAATMVARSLGAGGRTDPIVLAALGQAGSFPPGRILE